MNVFSRVSWFALAPLVSAACRALGSAAVSDGAAAVTRFLTDRLSDRSQRVTAALADASERGWRTLELALAGESLATAADRADDRAFRDDVRSFLLDARFDDRAPAVLRELREARAAGVLTGDGEAAPPGDLSRFADPAGVVAAEWKLADELANELRAKGYPALAAFLALRPPGDPTAAPLLAVAVRYHFRRALEDDAGLFRGLAFAQLERLGRAQEDGTARLAEQLSRIEARLGVLTAPAPGGNAVVPEGETNGPSAGGTGP